MHRRESVFEVVSDFQPTGDQPEAIDALVSGLNQGLKRQTLLGVTGSGKTFTMANVIEKWGRPTLVLAPNRTLAAQLCSEFKEFFRTTRLSTSFRTTTTTSLRLIYRARTRTSPKTPTSTTR